MIAYLNGRYLKKEELVISPDDRGFLFGDGVYEVVRLYEGRPFRLRQHLARLTRGAGVLRFPRADFAELPEVIAELIRRNDLHGADATVYIQVTRGAAPRGHGFPSPDTPATVYAVPKLLAAHKAEGSATPCAAGFAEQSPGITAIVVPDQRWERCDIKTVCLLANVLAHQAAIDAGCQEAIFSRNGSVLEGSHSNLVIVKDGKVRTPPRTNHILPGITREVLLRLCSRLSIPCAEQTLFESDLAAADEVMIVGTTVEVTPILAIDGKPVADGKPGPVTAALRNAFRDLIRHPAQWDGL